MASRRLGWNRPSDPLPPLPYGWFRIAAATDLGPGAPKSVRIVSNDFIVWRNSAGQPVVMDAYCPHLGAHLGQGGVTSGDTIQCPFHGWTFDQTGRIVEVPYSDRQPLNARVRVYTTVEWHGQIVSWLHPETSDPEFDLPCITSQEPGHAVKVWTVKTSWQDILENAVDFAHLPVIHKTKPVPKKSATFRADGFTVETSQMLHTPLGHIDARTTVSSVGPGLEVVRLCLDRGTNYRVTFSLFITPIEPALVELALVFLDFSPNAEDKRSRVMRKVVVAQIVRQIEEDIAIWDHKSFAGAPMLVRQDHPIRDYRRWVARFHCSG